MTAIHVTVNMIVIYMVTFTFLVMEVIVAEVINASVFVPVSPKHLVRAQMLQQLHIQLPWPGIDRIHGQTLLVPSPG